MTTIDTQDAATPTSGGGPVETARAMADSVATAAADVRDRLPEAMATTRDALAEAGRTIQTGSDDQLSAGTLVSVGFALGLLVGGANRLLVLLALVPAGAMALTLLDRQSGSSSLTGASRTTDPI